MSDYYEKAIEAILVVDDWYRSPKHYQFLLHGQKWVEISDFFDKPKILDGEITGIYEVENVFYVVGPYGISTLNNEQYLFPHDDYVNYEYFTSCVIGNNILIVRHVCFESKGTLEFKLLDTKSKQVSDLLIETSRYGFAVVEFLNQVWIVGGHKGILQSEQLNTVQIYDPKYNALFLPQIELVQARSVCKLIVYKNKLFVFGGCFGYDKPLKSVEMYSADTNKFVLMAPMKTARYSFGCCRVGNLVYVIGGYTKDESTRQDVFLKSVEVYNLDTDTWSEGVSLPEPLSGLHACASTKKLE